MKSNNTKILNFKNERQKCSNLYVHNTNRIKSILKLINSIKNVKANEILHNWCLDVNYIIHKRKCFRVDRFEE